MPSQPSDYSIHLSGPHLDGRTFLLGNEAGFVLYLPVEQNVRDPTMVPIKWFGASEFGRKYLEVSRFFMIKDGKNVHLDRENQTGFTQYLDRTERTYKVGTTTVRQTLLVPNHVRAFLLTLEADGEAGFGVEPEFDMRYYQALNSDFSGYRAEVAAIGGCPVLSVSNRIKGPETVEYMEFHALVAAVEGEASVHLFPESGRLRDKVYLEDERRRMLIESSYALTHETAPDEAPIWNTDRTRVYAPARVQSPGSVTLAFAFGGSVDDAREALGAVTGHVRSLRTRKCNEVDSLLQRGGLRTGVPDIDTAYYQVLSRFDEALVARDITIHAGEKDITHFSAIFAGNKYFLDAWKRDENISLIAPLLTNDWSTVAAILRETWQYQDPRTGRLPQIIRLGEPLVYFSSDGTLWALRRLWQFTRMTGDHTLLNDKYGMVEHFFKASLDFVKGGLLPSGGIVNKDYLWETWEDTPYTPRNGFPVEIELLWLTALHDYEPIIRRRNRDLADKMATVHEAGMQSFKRFYLDGYLADSLTYDMQPRTILTPNGYIAFDLDFPLPADLTRRMVMLAREQLAGQAGVKSLARRDWEHVLSPAFLKASGSIVDGHLESVGLYNYHRGVEWLWLNQFLVKGELECGDAETAFDLYLCGQVHSALHQMAVGGLSELYDVHGPLGADFQAWSMASFIASLHAFCGLEVDAVEKRIRVRPDPPRSWPAYSCRRGVGATRFDVSFRRNESGEQVVHITPMDALPGGYTLSLGVRIPHGEPEPEVQVNGGSVPVRRESSGVPDTYEIWADVPFTEAIHAVFRMHSP